MDGDEALGPRVLRKPDKVIGMLTRVGLTGMQFSL